MVDDSEEIEDRHPVDPIPGVGIGGSGERTSSFPVRLRSGFKKHRRVLVPLIVFLICFLVYGIAYAVFLKVVVNGKDVYTTDGDEVQYLVVTESIISDHDLSPLNNYMDKCYMVHGYYQRQIDLPAIVAGAGGRMVYSHMPFMSTILLPGFWLFGYKGAAGTMMLLTALAATFVFLILRRFTREWSALAATFAFFLTYPILIYSRLIYTNTVMVFMLALALWASLCLKESGRWSYALVAGLAAGALLQLHIKSAMIILCLFFLAWACSRNRKRDIALWIAPVALSFIIFIVLTLYLYGPNLFHGLTISSGTGGFFGKDSFWGVFGLYLDRAWGLFIFAPLYFIFIPGVPLIRDKKDLSRWWVFIPLCIVLHTFTMGMFGKWSGEVSPIPRHLIDIIVLLVICGGIFYDRVKKPVFKIIAGVLLLFQIVLTIFELINPLSTFAIHDTANALIPKVLGDNFLSDWLVRVFPLLHPISFKSAVLLLAWLVFLGVLSYFLRKKWMDPLYTGME